MLFRSIAVIASSDLTHYGTDYGETPAGTGEEGMAHARANDEELLDNVVNLDPEGVLEHALSEGSACGGGALAAAIVAARGLGAQGCKVLEHTSSHAQEPSSESWVGYAAALFHR